MKLRQIRLYVLFTVALCALQAMGLHLGTALNIDFGWSTVVLANLIAAQAVLWSFVRQTGRGMSQIEKLRFAGYAAFLTTLLALGVIWLSQAATGALSPGAGIMTFIAAQDLYDLAYGFGVSVAAIVMGLSFGTRTSLRLRSRFGKPRHSAGAANRV
ncbi:hypothetical protein [Tropicimonas sp. S265A]|uniref:hypothetical protein n=1 Tax=Tropicimonas sp. S265A TaxID=3415134 RepID=UPI003C7B623A